MLPHKSFLCFFVIFHLGLIGRADLRGGRGLVGNLLTNPSCLWIQESWSFHREPQQKRDAPHSLQTKQITSWLWVTPSQRQQHHPGPDVRGSSHIGKHRWEIWSHAAVSLAGFFSLPVTAGLRLTAGKSQRSLRLRKFDRLITLSDVDVGVTVINTLLRTWGHNRRKSDLQFF